LVNSRRLRASRAGERLTIVLPTATFQTSITVALASAQNNRSVSSGTEFVLIARYTQLIRLSLCAALLACTPALALADRQQDPELGPLLQRAIKAGECFEDRFEREVWFAAMEPRLRQLLANRDERVAILEQVQCEAKRLRLPPALVMAVIDVESRFDRWAVSSAGAVGLMQVMPFWPRQLGMSNDQLVRIPQNIRMGCTILKFYLDREKGDYTRALARYNGSTGRRNYSDLVLGRLANRWQYR
jgi:soluble lytic murein transglycosylase-like protein